MTNSQYTSSTRMELPEEAIRHIFTLILHKLGMNPDDPNLKDTPQRIGKMYVELFANIDGEFDDYRCFPNDKKYNQIIMVDNIHFTSMCSHHFLPFSGKAWIL